MTLNDTEWPFCVKFCFAPVCLHPLKPGFRATLKEQLRHRAFSLRQLGFLVQFGGILFVLSSSLLQSHFSFSSSSRARNADHFRSEGFSLTKMTSE